MHYKVQLSNFKKQLQKRYKNLVEKSNSYRHINEAVSDLAAFKAMKVLEKLNRFRYLNREVAV
ncbi:Lacal_2735 family protein [Polaribacter vadi]|uniref:Lacal_2735 family protein n=1 Tax=Polaribacter TaxID=52959 RepID=UPI001C08837A|nr:MULTISPECIES: Lacal_2735 family protein [Polaribacter]MBU3010759.1 Lacal_2735 family protein [Polaribacter vadi]MDO6740570.1 Lacal_2735 family protein [Polaribacter sp. 1_MG-2023]